MQASYERRIAVVASHPGANLLTASLANARMRAACQVRVLILNPKLKHHFSKIRLRFATKSVSYLLYSGSRRHQVGNATGSL